MQVISSIAAQPQTALENMLDSFSSLRKVAVYGGLTAVLAFASPKPAHSQVVPQPWVSVGSEDEAISYAAGARFLDFGVEVGGGGEAEGEFGIDVLKFVSVPLVSPYVGLGWYSGDESFAYSAGVQVRPPGNVFVGVGYHSLRGINGQIGVKF